MKDSPLVTFILGMAASLVLFGILVLAGPRLAPNQLNQCWVELRKNMPNCSTKIRGGSTYVRDLRCIRSSEGLTLLSEGSNGWYRIGKLPAPVKTPEKQAD